MNSKSILVQWILECGERRVVCYIRRVRKILQKFYKVRFLRRSTNVLIAFVYLIKDEVKLVLKSNVFFNLKKPTDAGTTR